MNEDFYISLQLIKMVTLLACDKLCKYIVLKATIKKTLFKYIQNHYRKPSNPQGRRKEKN
jgi:hypothetical protein